jgi:hypothetical protein
MVPSQTVATKTQSRLSTSYSTYPLVYYTRHSQPSPPPPLLNTQTPCINTYVISTPPHTHSTPFPPLPHSTPPTTNALDLKQVLTAAKKLNRGSAPGPSGWTVAHTLFILNNKSLGPLFLSFITYIINGSVSGTARTRLLASRLIPIPKDPFAHGICPTKDMIRPVAVGEVFYRLAAQCALCKCGPLSTLFPEIQRGLHKDSVERVVHSINAHLDLTEHILKEKPAGIFVDFAAAFQTLDRSTIASAFFNTKQLEPAFRLFEWAYAKQFDLLLFDKLGYLLGQVPSTNGVRRGHALASIAFAVTVQPIFRSCLQREARGFAIIDDFTITGPLHDVASSYTQLKRYCDHINFKVNTTKTFIYLPHTDGTCLLTSQTGPRISTYKSKITPHHYHYTKRQMTSRVSTGEAYRT